MEQGVGQQRPITLHDRIVAKIFDIREKTKNKYFTMSEAQLRDYEQQIFLLQTNSTTLLSDGRLTDTEDWSIQCLTRATLEGIVECRQQNSYWQSLMRKIRH